MSGHQCGQAAGWHWLEPSFLQKGDRFEMGWREEQVPCRMLNSPLWQAEPAGQAPVPKAEGVEPASAGLGLTAHLHSGSAGHTGVESLASG